MLQKNHYDETSVLQYLSIAEARRRRDFASIVYNFNHGIHETHEKLSESNHSRHDVGEGAIAVVMRRRSHINMEEPKSCQSCPKEIFPANKAPYRFSSDRIYKIYMIFQNSSVLEMLLILSKRRCPNFRERCLGIDFGTGWTV